MLEKIALISIGGAIGAVLRHSSISLIHKVINIALPLGTIFVNIIGCFAIGLLWGLFEKHSAPMGLRIFVFVGILGGFTTFSSFGLETINLFRGGEIKLAFLNIIISNFFGIAAVFFGFYLAELLSFKLN